MLNLNKFLRHSHWLLKLSGLGLLLLEIESLKSYPQSESRRVPFHRSQRSGETRRNGLPAVSESWRKVRKLANVYAGRQVEDMTEVNGNTPEETDFRNILRAGPKLKRGANRKGKSQFSMFLPTKVIHVGDLHVDHRSEYRSYRT